MSDCRVSLVVTGFGVFADVLDNPSMRIVNELSSNSYLCDAQDTSVQYKILEVSVDHCSKFHDACILPETDNIKNNTIYVHIGVDSKGTHIKLEECAYNNMNFRVPDVKGYQPEGETISPTCSLDEPLNSGLPLGSLCQALNETFSAEQVHTGEDCPLVQLSQDPGRYLCNYIYYQALQHQKDQHQPLQSVFVHVPACSVVPQEVQVKVVKELLTSISALARKEPNGGV